MTNFYKNYIIVKWRLMIFLLLLMINLLFIFLFYTEGATNYMNTILFYSLLIFGIFLFTKNKKVAINLIAIFVILFIGESYLRISKKGNMNYTEVNSNSIFANYNSQIFGEKNRIYLGYRINPPNSTSDYSSLDFSYPHIYNEMGLREHPLVEFKNTKNILLLGDSFTEGAGAPEDSTLCKSLEYHLGNNIKCINAGVRGSDPVYEYQLLDTLFQLTRPQLIICNLTYSDIPDIIMRGGDERFTVGYRKQFWWEYFYASSFIFRKVMLDIFKYNPFQIQYEDMAFGVDVIMRKMISFKQFCNTKNIPFLCIITPSINELVNPETFNFQESFLELNHHIGIHFLNTQYGIVDYLNSNHQFPETLYHLPDQHMNSKGYWLEGTIIADFIKNNMK